MSSGRMLAAVRVGTLKFPVSERGAAYQHRILLRQYMDCYNGGGMFGWDTRTLNANEPELFVYLTRLERFKAPVTFKDVAMAMLFDFVDDAQRDCSFSDRCAKISARRYRSLRTGLVYRIGTIHAKVFHVEGSK